jgi:hypothetical protein
VLRADANVSAPGQSRWRFARLLARVDERDDLDIRIVDVRPH